MRIFFLCRTGHHTSLLAAGLFLGLFKDNDQFREVVQKIRGFGNISLSEIGTPFFVGKDKSETEVYTIGVLKESILLERAANEFINVIGGDSKKRKIINVSSAVSFWTKAGLFLNRFRLTGLANRFFVVGASREIRKVSELLEKDELKNIIMEK